MKFKFFMATMAVAFSFAMISCTGNKTTNAASSADSIAVETVDAATSVETDSCCQQTDSCAKQTDCADKKSCCDKK